MGRTSAIMLALPLLFASAPVFAQAGVAPPDPAAWDRARQANQQTPVSPIASAVARWQVLTQSSALSFGDYAGFLIAYPGFPQEEALRQRAESALAREFVDPARLVSYFDRQPPLTNPARAKYALALRAMGRPDATQVALAAWRGGPMADADESALLSAYGTTFTAADHDARMDALLWAGATAAAQRQLAWVSAQRKPIDAARLAYAQGMDPASIGLATDPSFQSDSGYVFNRARQLRRSGQAGAAVALQANRPVFRNLPQNQAEWVEELLVTARLADAGSAVRIASKIDDAFAPGTDISRLGFGLRDDYTSLMWLGGTRALWDLGDGRAAAPLFYRYGAAARTPQTRAKGFYWAGRAAQQAGDATAANRYFSEAADYGDQFYGLLARERLGLPVLGFADRPTAVPTPAQVAAFNARPLTQAVREVAKFADWPVTVRFFREIADRADTETDHVMVADLARQIGRRDLAVILGQAAGADGHRAFQTIAFPELPVPPGYASSWTAVHAIGRQESQFAANAISHAGARGLMQLMPGTAREQAGKLGLDYNPDALVNNPSYNMQLGAAYFSRMMDYFGGSWPLAIAAYNAGAGNVNKFLRLNGDPRTGSIDWVTWVERIPLSETRNYVQRVIENAVVYEALYPGHSIYHGDAPTSWFLGKRTTG